MAKFPITIQFNDYTRISTQKGSNMGGFFEHNKTKKVYYIKWIPETFDKEKNGKYKNRNFNRCCNEVLASRIYELYGVSVPKMEFITFINNGLRYYGITSEKEDGIIMLKNADKNVFEQVRKKAQEDFLIDVLLSNYDVIGWGMDNMFFHPETKEPFRLDPGGALRYRAQGGAKKEQFNVEVDEFEDMESGTNSKTKFNEWTLADAGRVFKGVHDSPALLISLRRLMSISNSQLTACVNEHGFDTGKEIESKGHKKNEALIRQLLSRKEKLIVKAEDKISNHLMNGLKSTKERRRYLQEAGISEENINAICSVIEKKSSKEVVVLIRAAIAPPNHSTFFKSEKMPESSLNDAPTQVQSHKVSL